MRLPIFVQLAPVRSWAILLVFLLYIVLKIQEFSWGLGHEFYYFLIKLCVGLLLFILIIPLGKGLHQLTVAVGYIALLFAINQLNLWTVSARGYLQDKQPLLSQAVAILKTKGNVSLGKADILKGKEPSLSTAERAVLLRLFDRTGIIEIESDKGNLLFIFDRFIDNGYAYLYVNNPGALTTKTPRVVYDLTSKILLEENWYYVSFT